MRRNYDFDSASRRDPSTTTSMLSGTETPARATSCTRGGGLAFVRIVASTLAPVTRIGGIVLFVEGRC
jgi:hypothetical protein